MSNVLKIVMAQLNFCVGDIKGNTQKIIATIAKARAELHADLVVFPELSLCGYPPEDLLLRADFHAQIKQAINDIKQHCQGIAVIIGYPHHTAQGTYNTASVFSEREIIATYHKQCLPNYGVFDEKRYFLPGEGPVVFTLKGVRIALKICEDLWHAEPITQVAQLGAQLVLSINASPFDLNKISERTKILQQRIAETHLPIMYVHGVGGQDDLVFDGGSLVLDKDGKIVAQAEFFAEQLLEVDIQITPELKILPTKLASTPSMEASVYQALVLAVRDYINKNGFPGVLIGLSGGIDSALTLAIAVDALGKDRVEVAILPSRYTSELSMNLANEIVQNFAVKASCISIESAYKTFLADLADEFAGLAADITEENLQARCRGVIMMALSNKTGKLVLPTGNKSEMAVGYATLYGDMAGGFAPLKDVPKTLVYRLAKYRNEIAPLIPQGVITRPPTAELALEQTDQDTLPPYDELDKILQLYVEQDASLAEITAAGFNEKTAQRIIAMVDHSEYKRRQAAMGPRITPRAFSRERRYPVTSKFKSS